MESHWFKRGRGRACPRAKCRACLSGRRWTPYTRFRREVGTWQSLEEIMTLINAYVPTCRVTIPALGRSTPLLKPRSFPHSTSTVLLVGPVLSLPPPHGILEAGILALGIVFCLLNESIWRNTSHISSSFDNITPVPIIFMFPK